MQIIGVPWPGRLARSRRFTDWFCLFLMTVLLGYVFIGRGFAYQGVPPIFVGEMALIGGFVAYALAGNLFAPLATMTTRLLLALMIWAVIRTVPYISIYGMDAPRDSIIVLYGVYTFFVIALLLEDKERLNRFLASYAFAASAFVILSPVMFIVTRFYLSSIPTIPAPGGEPILLWSFRPGQFGVHLAGAGLFMFLGLARPSYFWIGAFLVSATMSSASSRGAMLALAVPILLASILTNRLRLLAKFMGYGLIGLVIAVIVESLLFEYRDVDTASSFDRSVGVRQAIAGFFSIFDNSGAQLSQTKEWRMMWWEIIIDTTVFGPDFWTGKGFGINLADADGFQVGNSDGAPPLRDPHSVHMTILARSGVPGLVLWLTVIGTWTWLVLRTSVLARRAGETKWADVLVFIHGYALAMVIESSFDLGLAGPMMGIPFWCLIGLGIAAATIYRTKLETEAWRRAARR